MSSPATDIKSSKVVENSPENKQSRPSKQRLRTVYCLELGFDASKVLVSDIEKTIKAKVQIFSIQPTFNVIEDPTLIKVIFGVPENGNPISFTSLDFFKSNRISPVHYRPIKVNSKEYKSLISCSIDKDLSCKYPIEETEIILNELNSLELVDDTKDFSIKGKFFHLTYPEHIPYEQIHLQLTEKLKRYNIDIKHYSFINEISIRFYLHCHVMIALSDRLNTQINDPRFFDLVIDGKSIHPNIKRRLKFTPYLLYLIFIYHSKTGILPHTSLKPEIIEQYKQKFRTEEEKFRVDIKKLTVVNLLETKEAIESNPAAYRSRLTQKQIDDILKRTKKIERVISKEPLSSYTDKIWNYIDISSTQLIIFCFNDNSDIEFTMKELYDKLEGTAISNDLKSIPRSIYNFNKTNLPPRVNNILVKGNYIKDDSLPNIIDGLHHKTLMDIRRKESYPLNFYSHCRIIFFTTEMPRKLNQHYQSIKNNTTVIVPETFKFENSTRKDKFSPITKEILETTEKVFNLNGSGYYKNESDRIFLYKLLN